MYYVLVLIGKGPIKKRAQKYCRNPRNAGPRTLMITYIIVIWYYV